MVAPRANVFGTSRRESTGLRSASADFSGGIIVNGYATDLEVSNNILVNNQGQAAGGIRVGHPSLYRLRKMATAQWSTRRTAT